MLSMKNVSKVFRTDLIETHALRDFSLDVKAGEFLAVTGPSGSGKTTFLNIAGLLEPYETGSYKLDDVEVTDLSDDARSRAAQSEDRLHLPELQPDARPQRLRQRRRAAALPPHEVRRAHKRITNALEIVGLAARMNHVPAQLSGGQQQRVAIARAIAGDPKLVLADEPTGNLDSLMARQVMDLLERINEMGTTIIMVTHDPELARRAHRNVQVVDGQISDFKPYEPHAAAGDRRRASHVVAHRRSLNHVRLLPAAGAAELPAQSRPHRAHGDGHRARHLGVHGDAHELSRRGAHSSA